MSDNLKLRGEPDRSLVSLQEPWEVKYLAEKYDVSTEIVVAAATFLGTRARSRIEALLDQHYPIKRRNALSGIFGTLNETPTTANRLLGLLSDNAKSEPGMISSLALQPQNCPD